MEEEEEEEEEEKEKEQFEHSVYIYHRSTYMLQYLYSMEMSMRAVGNKHYEWSKHKQC